MGRRRKKRTSIETPIRLALEKAFIANQKPTSEDITQLADALYIEKEVVSEAVAVLSDRNARMLCVVQNRSTNRRARLSGGAVKKRV